MWKMLPYSLIYYGDVLLDALLLLLLLLLLYNTQGPQTVVNRLGFSICKCQVK